jgi:hypothetical protein
MRHILSNSMHLTGAGGDYTRRASGMGVDCIDGLSQYRTQTQSSHRIHPYPSDFYLWLKNYKGFVITDYDKQPEKNYDMGGVMSELMKIMREPEYTSQEFIETVSMTF